MADAPASLRKRDQTTNRGDSKGSGGKGDLADSSQELGKYGWQKLHQTSSHDKRRGVLVTKEIVTQLDKPTVLLRSMLSFKTAHWVDAAAILEVCLYEDAQYCLLGCSHACNRERGGGRE